ncbi:adaptin protein [Halapricum hydrolyticum]|uniref:Adaptin protein n=1 Tax=Halapricum hydrolyticum TaxID=2979991 RepID=A0AAE3LFM9_9EURY|nr:adaptin protein [Halapricum hydrolyticum]MCU4718926.1 adaptin protein [Halapricum hydrolyticum]MCU4727981.1 adaptin protein [Halapricum hydrolyticum]
MSTSVSGYLVLAFDRDRTVDVNPPADRSAVPLSWIEHWANETDHEVWAIGNQRLKSEAGIPGVREAVMRLENEWYREFNETDDDEHVDGWPRRARRVEMLAELFPDADDYLVVDDKDLSYIEDWTHYYPWEFVDVVRSGDVDLEVTAD